MLIFNKVVRRKRNVGMLLTSTAENGGMVHHSDGNSQACQARGELDM
jgi:hypothetical protein